MIRGRTAKYGTHVPAYVANLGSQGLQLVVTQSINTWKSIWYVAREEKK